VVLASDGTAAYSNSAHLKDKPHCSVEEYEIISRTILELSINRSNPIIPSESRGLSCIRPKRHPKRMKDSIAERKRLKKLEARKTEIISVKSCFAEDECHLVWTIRSVRCGAAE